MNEVKITSNLAKTTDKSQKNKYFFARKIVFYTFFVLTFVVFGAILVM